MMLFACSCGGWRRNKRETSGNKNARMFPHLQSRWTKILTFCRLFMQMFDILYEFFREICVSCMQNAKWWQYFDILKLIIIVCIQIKIFLRLSFCIIDSGEKWSSLSSLSSYEIEVEEQRRPPGKQNSLIVYAFYF